MWKNEVVLEYLELYRGEQILWDPQHPSHRNRVETATAWLRIQNALSIDCSVVDLKKKKESLMTSFRMHCSKKKKCDNYEPMWFAYPLMASFLGGKYECGSNMESEFNNNSSGAQSNSTQSIRQGHSNRTTTNSGDKHRNNHYKMKACSIPSQTETNNSELVYTKRKMAEAVSILNTDTNEKMDECELYAKLLAKKLRKLEEHQRDLAMHQIDNIMFRAKMKSEQRTRSFSSSPESRKVKSPIFIVASESLSHYEDENMTYEENIETHPPL